ncbi:hypothetical protein HID58_088062 [Brassica napus]|uniref:Uncharacterized protein n=2 Tax=Brassica napus TaxID=3708 RepID=A0ABQ7XV65_BRANA|nr:hypothetical protein HID58_088062 [Brassica napus]CDY64334.1 BnaC09g53520D [Brassica napus]
MTGPNTVSGDEHRSDIDESKVKAPNMFERAKEEIDAVIGAIHQRKSSRDESDKMEIKSEEKPNVMRRAKEEIKSLFHSKEKPHRHHHHHHHKETHGRSDDIDENTPVNEVKAPNVFERAKEEIEAVVETIHPRKNEAGGSDSPKRSPSVSPDKERAGLGCSLGKGLEKICSPWGNHSNPDHSLRKASDIIAQELSKEAHEKDNTSKNPAIVIALREPIMRRNMDNHAYDLLGHKTPNIHAEL